MSGKKFSRGSLVAIFILGCTLLSYPALSIFNVKSLVFGIPLLYLYIFASWSAIIFLVFCVVKWHTNVESSQLSGPNFSPKTKT